MTIIESTFASGSCLGSLPSSCSTTTSGRLSLTMPAGPKRPSFPYAGPSPWNESTPLPGALKALIDSPLFTAIPSLAGITARILPLLTESSLLEGWNTMQATTMRLEKVASNVENCWAQSALAGIENDDDIGTRFAEPAPRLVLHIPNTTAPESRKAAANIRTILKTLLLTTIVLSQSSLSITYSRPVSSPSASLEPKLSPVHPPTHLYLALSTLRTLSHISFVIAKLGGVTSTSSAGFAELKRMFYSALDVLSADVNASETFVRTLNAHSGHSRMCCHERLINLSIQVPTSSRKGATRTGRFIHAREAFNLPCVEQLIPLLSLDTIEHVAFVPSVRTYVTLFSSLSRPVRFSSRDLNDASCRETYESSHSVILAIFAAHALAQPDSTTVAEMQGTRVLWPTFVEKIVPFNIQCLLENSGDGKLMTPQLCLAFCALTGAHPCAGAILPLLSPLHTLRPFHLHDGGCQRRHRLRLVLVSTLSALPLALLPDALSAVADAIRDPKGEELVEMVGEVFKEIMENVGDREKDYCLQ
ncbi:hypothetical protein BJV78DRAFT_786419 [Lactifluus subvellereus]|nr:hypothetical protein BJV78DRAFT_786419 [Lactifluus subvellereus]